MNSINDIFISAVLNICSELGDKTFILIMIMAKKHSQLSIFMGAFFAQLFSSAFTCLIGVIIPFLLPFGKLIFLFVTNMLFIFFGVSLLNKVKKKIKDGDKNKKIGKTMKLYEEINNKNKDKEIFWKVLVTNFFGEFGDKSQLSTITLSFNHDAIMIYIGGMLGQTFCILIAIFAGKFIGNKIPDIYLNAIGGILFIVMGISSFF